MFKFPLGEEFIFANALGGSHMKLIWWYACMYITVSSFNKIRLTHRFIILMIIGAMIKLQWWLV